MVRVRLSENGIQRLLNNQCGATRNRVAARTRSKRKGITLTPIQKLHLKIERLSRTQALNEALRDARDAIWQAARKMHADFQSHTVEYYSRLIMQTTRLRSRTRKPSRWNAFLSKEIQLRNADTADGQDRVRVSDGDVTREIAEKWKAMSKREQVAATDDALAELQERRENHQRGTHVVPIQAFHDTKTTLASMQWELEDLYTRTGTETLLIAVRSDTAAYNAPFSFASSERVEDFIVFATKNVVEVFASRLDGYCVSGAQGIAQNYVQGLLKLKQEAAVLINTKLQHTCTRSTVTRMAYVNFDVRITARHGVVLEHWPLKKFCAPGEICSRPELETLISAFTTGAARFRSLSDEEWDNWKANRTGSGSPPNANAPSDAPGAPASGDGSPDTSSTAATTDTPAVSSSPIPGTVDMAGSTSANLSSSATMLGNVVTQVPEPGLPSPAQVSAPTEGATGKRGRAAGTTFIAMDVVTGSDGRSIAVAKRQRKTRKDKVAQDAPTASSSGSAPTDGDVSAAPKPTRRSKNSKKTKKTAQASAAA